MEKTRAAGGKAAADRALEAFAKRFGAKGRRLARAPGRVNIIGEHTDYNGGFVLPAAIDAYLCVAFRPRDDGKVNAYAVDSGESDEFDTGEIEHVKAGSWKNYLRGVAFVLGGELGSVGGMDCTIAGDVPIGAGLSSSAAFEVAAELAFLDVSGKELDTREVALLAQKAENEFVGVRCGIMDQFISVHAKAVHALFLDCRDLTYEHHPIPQAATLVVAETGVQHELAATEYNQRRAACESAAEKLTAGNSILLRDVPDDVRLSYSDEKFGLTQEERRLARHVFTENDRTRDCAAAFGSGDLASAGRLMAESHASLRDDYRVSCKELDSLAEIATSTPGVFGSRMTGGGFGGCTVSLVAREEVGTLIAALQRGYRRPDGKRPRVWGFDPAAGAEVVSSC